VVIELMHRDLPQCAALGLRKAAAVRHALNGATSSRRAPAGSESAAGMMVTCFAPGMLKRNEKVKGLSGSIRSWPELQ
jgi:hypothetical protein